MRLRRITNQEKKNYRTLRKSTTKRVELPCCAGLAKKRQVVASCEILLQKVESSSTFCNKTCTLVADPGEGPKGPGPSPLILRPKWGPNRRAEKKFFWDRHPPLSQGLDDDRAPPPYLKVWIRHCTCCEFNRLKQTCCNSCVWRDSYVILSNQRLVFTQLATSWFVARQA